MSRARTRKINTIKTELSFAGIHPDAVFDREPFTKALKPYLDNTDKGKEEQLLDHAISVAELITGN